MAVCTRTCMSRPAALLHLSSCPSVVQFLACRRHWVMSVQDACDTVMFMTGVGCGCSPASTCPDPLASSSAPPLVCSCHRSIHPGLCPSISAVCVPMWASPSKWPVFCDCSAPTEVCRDWLWAGPSSGALSTCGSFPPQRGLQGKQVLVGPLSEAFIAAVMPRLLMWVP